MKLHVLFCNLIKFILINLIKANAKSHLINYEILYFINIV